MLPAMFFALSIAPAPSASQILRKCQHAYDAVRSMDETVHATANGFPATARILFSRPGKLKATGTTMFNSDYAFIFDGLRTWVLLQGRWMQQETAQVGIEQVTGISAGAATLVPSLLLHAKSTGIGDFSKPGAKVSLTTSDGRKTFKIDVAKPIPRSLWIDSRTYFIVRSESSEMKTKFISKFDPPKVNVRIPAGSFSRG